MMAGSRIRFVWLSAFLLFAALQLSAQQSTKVTMQVISVDEHPVEAATIELVNANDSALVKAVLSEKNGQVLLENVSLGRYFIRISAVGMQPYNTEKFTITSGQGMLEMGIVTMKNRPSSQLEGITVNGRRPFIQKLSDRFIMNVENSIVSAGGTAADVLSKAPGVTVDASDNITLSGKSGLIVMVDGKVVPLNGSDLHNFLSSFSSASIDRIEVITAPSAKYDAAGSAGIIDIRLKKNQQLGTNGNVNLSAGKGYFYKAGATTSINHRNGWANFYGTYSFSDRKGYTNLSQYKSFFDPHPKKEFDIQYKSQFPFVAHNFRLGADLTPGPKTTIGIMLTGDKTSDPRNGTSIVTLIDERGRKTGAVEARTIADVRTGYFFGNLNVKRSLARPQDALSFDLDLGRFNNQPVTRIASIFTDENGTPTGRDSVLVGDQEGSIDVATVKLDYAIGLLGGRVEAGARAGLVHSDNGVVFWNQSNGLQEYDSSRSNHFIYQENNQAGYLTYSGKLAKISFTGGLRLEHTYLKGAQAATKTVFDSSYLQLFPSLLVSLPISTKQTVSASVKKRIDRPGFLQLNPFRTFLDPTTFRTGNPALKPQLSWVYELGYAVTPFSFSLSHTSTKNYFMTIAKPATGETVSFQEPTNFERFTNTSLTVIAPVRIRNWWRTMMQVVAYRNVYKGFAANTYLDEGLFQSDITLNNSFALPKGWSAELNGTYISSARFGFMTAQPYGYVTAGLQKMMWNERATIRLTVNDIFETSVRHGIHLFRSYTESWTSRRETRVGYLSFSYRFGNKKVQSAPKRITSSEEETKRATGN
jgi:iron complex outermembrane recepter protein